MWDEPPFALAAETNLKDFSAELDALFTMGQFVPFPYRCYLLMTVR